MYYESDEEIEDERKWNKVRERNIKINIAKQLIANGRVEEKSFTKQDLKDLFAFKESDILYIAPNIFDISGEQYVMNLTFSEFIDKIIQSNKAVKDALLAAEAEFIKLYSPFREEAERNMFGVYAGDKYRKMFEKLKEFIPIIHWGRLPIFNKYLIYNRERDPELETIEFYEDPDCLNALLKEVKNQGIVLSNKSDNTLNKKITFKVYTRRWGHENTYSIKRTVNGWYCKYIAIRGECKKNGEGGLFMNLDHDSVFYPKEGVAYAMEKLWEDADDEVIDFDELAKRIQQIADWISAVEKSMGEQPEWVGY
ncbi:hypothetical protein LIP56_03040 [Anaerostipes hadrus]|uniref:hypothetical protein n=1 Tax=Anaerostipes hadrus TaxID=649756 RepID=UPI001D022DB7|nr:hypothetical protein [Anaerostipes hadrus]MCB5543043.1 hypothetical protein [Anaerostipes hadrus]